ncbi:MAG: hypothetical protein ACXV3U_07245 [Halobacteriota archaeon]
MALSNDNGCYYGPHFGCLGTQDGECRRCAERLTRAVQHAFRVEEKSSKAHDVLFAEPPVDEVTTQQNEHALQFFTVKEQSTVTGR